MNGLTTNTKQKYAPVFIAARWWRIALNQQLIDFGDSALRVWPVTARVTSWSGIERITVMPPMRSCKVM